MLALRPGTTMARALLATLAALAILAPLAARAALANHDWQSMVFHRCNAMKHDRALGPLASGAPNMN